MSSHDSGGDVMLGHSAGQAARRVWLAAAALSIVTAPSARAQGRALRGVVRDSTGVGIIGAEVSVAGVHVVSGVDGAFVVSAVPHGSARLDVRRLGFAPRSLAIDSTADGARPIDVVLTPLARSLEPVAIKAHREPFDARLDGFNQRLALKRGYFITREQIDKNSNALLIDALRHLPGVRVVTLPGARGRSVNLGGFRCPPLVFVDGSPATSGAVDLDMFDLGGVEGVEVYSSESSIPPELFTPIGPQQCGVIAVWSRPFRPRTREQSGDARDVAALVASHAAFTVDQVDTAASYITGSTRPLYPSSALRARTHGRVVVEVVVDTIGRVEPASINVVSATSVTFSDAARDAAAQARFTPAYLKNRRVRQVARLTFDFDPSALSPDDDRRERR